MNSQTTSAFKIMVFWLVYYIWKIGRMQKRATSSAFTEKVQLELV